MAASRNRAHSQPEALVVNPARTAREASTCGHGHRQIFADRIGASAPSGRMAAMLGPRPLHKARMEWPFCCFYIRPVFYIPANEQQSCARTKGAFESILEVED
jgi:hypothetical protein